jgi:flagellar protein FliJ
MATASKSQRLMLVSGLAETALAKASDRLRAANAHKDQQDEQLLNLKNYRDQYIETMRVTLHGQNNAYRLTSYQKFILQLADAISQQENICKLAGEQCEAERRNWIAAREKHKSMLRLAEQTLAKEQAEALKKEEARQMDDFIASRTRR